MGTSDKFGLDTLATLLLKMKVIFYGPFCIFLPTFSPKQVYIDLAYSNTQRLMLTTSVCIIPISFISIVFWKNAYVKAMRKKDQVLL